MAGTELAVAGRGHEGADIFMVVSPVPCWQEILCQLTGPRSHTWQHAEVTGHKWPQITCNCVITSLLTYTVKS